MEKPNTCLWCKTDLPEGQYFCMDAGKTIKGGESKSLCYTDFLNIFESTIKNRIPLTEDQQKFLMLQKELKVWFNSLE